MPHRAAAPLGLATTQWACLRAVKICFRWASSSTPSIFPASSDVLPPFETSADRTPQVKKLVSRRPPAVSVTPNSDILPRGNAGDLDRAIGDLKPDCRIVFMLRDIEKL